MEGREIPYRLAGPPNVAEAEAIPITPGSGRLSPRQLVMSAAAAAGEEPTRQKKRKRKKHKEQAEVAVSPSQSPHPPATPEPKPEAPVPYPPETLSSEAEPAAATARRKEHKRKKREKNQEAAAPATYPFLEPVEEAVGKEGKKKRKRRKHEEAAASRSLPTAAGAPILEGDKAAAPEEAPALARSPLLEPVEEARGKEGKKKRKARKHEEVASSRSQPVAAGAPILEGDKAPAAAEALVPATSPVLEPVERRRKEGRKKRKGRKHVEVAASPSQPAAAGAPILEGDKAVAPARCPLLEPVEETRGKDGEKKRKGRKHGEAAASPSQPAAAEAPILEGDKAAAEVLAPAPVRSQLLEPVEEARGKGGKKKRKGMKHEEATVSPSHPTTAGSPILEGDKGVATALPAATTSRKQRRGKVEQEQSIQSPLPSDNHPQDGGGEEAANGPKSESVTVRRSSKKPLVLSTREIIRMRIEARKQQPLPEGFLDAMAMAKSNPNSTEQDTKYSSPLGVFFDQFCYKPNHQRDRNPPAHHKTPYCPARPLPQGQPTSVSSQLTANEIPKAAKIATLTANVIPKAAKTTTLNAKRPRVASTSSSQEKLQSKDKEKPEKKPREPPPMLSTAEKRSEKYRRLPLDQLVPPPCSPHKLLQEKYASDPWKVIVICMLLNLTQGKQVRKKVKGFFKRYPDAQTACNADSEKMAEYLTPLGLQRVKTKRIQKFSKAYVEQEWTYVTELCGVGKYAADAYAIFCAGKAREVVPEDHKLVDYWKYVCFELPVIEGSQNAHEEAGMTELENGVPRLQELAVCC